jgi:inosine-uridine nucleoside N-ribohydrolase
MRKARKHYFIPDAKPTDFVKATQKQRTAVRDRGAGAAQPGGEDSSCVHSSQSGADLISRIRIPLVWVAFILGTLSVISAQAERQKVIIEGDDVDDAFALALAVKSPELEILGVTTTFGDTETRARIVDRFLGEVGRTEIPVLAGHPTSAKTSMSQGGYALGGHWAKSSHGDAVDFILDQIRKYPGEVTLIGIGPLVNVGAAIDRNATTFRKLKRVVIMGGSIRRGYGDFGYNEHFPPSAEWNIRNDVASAQKLFASGVPLYVMPLDSTQLKLDEVKRAFLFTSGTPVTDGLTILYHMWAQETPTLFDPMAVAFALRPELCPVTPLHIRVDENGYTREECGLTNAQVCLDSKPDDFFLFYLRRVGGAE